MGSCYPSPCHLLLTLSYPVWNVSWIVREKVWGSEEFRGLAGQVLGEIIKVWGRRGRGEGEDAGGRRDVKGNLDRELGRA